MNRDYIAQVFTAWKRSKKSWIKACRKYKHNAEYPQIKARYNRMLELEIEYKRALDLFAQNS